MFTAVLVIVIILAILLILAVLIQNSKGGLSSTMGSASSQLIGVKRTTDLLEKVTWGLAISIMILCLVSNFVLERPSDTSDEEVSTVNTENAATNSQPATSSPAATSGDSGK